MAMLRSQRQDSVNALLKFTSGAGMK